MSKFLAITVQFKALLPHIDANEHTNMFRREHDHSCGEKLSKLIYGSATLPQHFPDYIALAGQMLGNRTESNRSILTY